MIKRDIADRNRIDNRIKQYHIFFKDNALRNYLAISLYGCIYIRSIIHSKLGKLESSEEEESSYIENSQYSKTVL